MQWLLIFMLGVLLTVANGAPLIATKLFGKFLNQPLDRGAAFIDLIDLLKEKDAEADRSVHFYFPNAFEDGHQSSNHIVIDASGFASRFRDFEKGCNSAR
jgi:hypothetical protein